MKRIKKSVVPRIISQTDTDSENDIFTTNSNNWPQLLVVKSANEELPLRTLSPFVVQNWFQTITGTLKKYQETKTRFIFI